MARQLRIQYEGAIYHLMNRGDRREEIVRDNVDRNRFLETLGASCLKTGWQLHAYCLMDNHFHLVVETPRANLVEGVIMDVRLQSSSPIKRILCVKVRTDPISISSVKYWELIADNLSKAGWSWGYVATVDSNGRTIWIAAAHRDDGKRFVVHADQRLTTFFELEAGIRASKHVVS